jgi:hypothetical protein
MENTERPQRLGAMPLPTSRGSRPAAGADADVLGDRPIPSAEEARPAAPARPTAAARPGLVAGLAVVAALGWGLAAYSYFVTLPAAQLNARAAATLDLVDRFYASPAEKAYVRLGDALKPWWEAIEETQRKILAARSEEEKLPLIQRRDEQLVAFIREHNLTGDVDLIVRAFEQFTRCLQADVCDEEILRGTIGIDVRRLYRTFKPWIQAQRDAGDRDYGRPLEDLFFRFIG